MVRWEPWDLFSEKHPLISLRQQNYGIIDIETYMMLRDAHVLSKSLKNQWLSNTSTLESVKTLFWEAIEIAKVRTTTSSVTDIKILSHFFTPPQIQYLIEKHWFFSDFPLFARNQNLIQTHHMCLVKLISMESLMSEVNQKNKIWASELLIN